MKKNLALILTLCLLMAVPAYAIEDPIPNQTAFPLTQEPITLQVFNWAHNYTRGEFGTQKIWERMEKLCAMLAGRDDIAYLTNKEALLEN